jgi:hypothetical protein
MEEDILSESIESINTINTINIINISINNIIDSRIKNILNTISLNYPDKFNKKLIEKECEYIKKHIILDKIKNNTKNTNDTDNTDNTNDINLNNKHVIKKKLIKIKHIHIHIKTPVVKKRIINIENQCSARVWNDSIFLKKNMKKVNDIENKYKVIDYKHIDLKSFIDKYVIGSRCLKTKCKDIQYCNLHSEHLIHGDYLEIPSKELCYHFIKDGKYL